MLAYGGLEGAGDVIAGRLFNLTAEQRESFLRYRAGLATVTVLGYDEVLERLKTLLTVLKSPPDSDGATATTGLSRSPSQG